MEQSPKDYIKSILLREIATEADKYPEDILRYSSALDLAPPAFIQRCLLELLAEEKATLTTESGLTIGPKVAP